MLRSLFAAWLAVAVFGVAVEAQRISDGFKMVEEVDEMWRFQVGNQKEGLGFGDDFVCVLSDKDKFLSFKSGLVFAGRDWCEELERFAVVPTSGGKFALRVQTRNLYISCPADGSTAFHEALDDTGKYQVYISDDGNQVSFYNPLNNNFLRTNSEDYVRCDVSSNEKSDTRFFGWKTGPKSAWMPRDEGRPKEEFDNLGSSSSKGFNYKKALGVEQISNTKAGFRTNAKFVPDSELGKLFVADIKSETGTNWKKMPDSVWRPKSTKDATWTANPKTYVKVYQVMGFYGPLKIFSDDFPYAELSEKPQSKQSVATT